MGRQAYSTAVYFKLWRGPADYVVPTVYIIFLYPMYWKLPNHLAVTLKKMSIDVQRLILPNAILLRQFLFLSSVSMRVCLQNIYIVSPSFYVHVCYTCTIARFDTNLI